MLWLIIMEVSLLLIVLAKFSWDCVTYRRTGEVRISLMEKLLYFPHKHLSAPLVGETPLLFPAGDPGHQLVHPADKLEVASEEEGGDLQDPAEERQLRLHDVQWRQQQHRASRHSSQGVLGGEVQLVMCTVIL